MLYSHRFVDEVHQFAQRYRTLIDTKFFTLLEKGDINAAANYLKDLARYSPSEDELNNAAEKNSAEEINRKFLIAKEASRLYMKFLSELNS